MFLNYSRFMKKICIIFILFFLSLYLITSQTAIEYYNLSLSEYFNENFNQAIHYLKLSLEKNPKYLDAYLQLAKIYYELENYEYAYTAINKALNFAPNDNKILLLAANIETMLGMYETAEKKFFLLLNENPLNIDAYIGLINLYFKTNKLLLAKKNLDKILSFSPNNFDAINLMAKYYEKIDIEKAKYYYSQNIETNSLNPDGYFYYSIFNFNNNNTHLAIENIKKALEIKDKISYRKYLAKYYLHLKQPDMALNHFKEILKKTNEAIDYYNIALAYEELSNFDMCVNSLKKTINLRNDDEIAHYFLNKILIDNYNIDDEIRINRSNVVYNEAIKAKKENSFDLYLFLLKEAIFLYPKNSEAREELAEYFLMQNLPERYIKELEVASKYSNKQSLLDKLSMEKRRIHHKLGDIWGINQYDIQNNLILIPLFVKKNINNYHYNSEKIIVSIFKNMITANEKFDLQPYLDEIIDSQKALIATQLNSPFYIDLYINEKSNMIEIEVKLVNANNFLLLKKYQTIKYGNNKVVLALSSLIKEINKDIPFSSNIIKINKNKAIINAGRSKNVKLNDELLILRKNSYPLEFARCNYLYNSNDIKAKAKVTKVDENISEIEIYSDDFYNFVDIGDFVIYKK